WHVNLLGAALYRAGRFEEAVTRLTEATELSCHPYRTNMLSTWFYLAMAHHRLGHVEEARRWLDQAVQGTQQALKSPAQPHGKAGNPGRVHSTHLGRERALGAAASRGGTVDSSPGDEAREVTLTRNSHAAAAMTGASRRPGYRPYPR